MSDSGTTNDLSLAAEIRRYKCRKRLGYLIISGIVCIAVLLVVIISRRNSRNDGKSAPLYVTEAVRRGGIKIKVTATGNLEPTNQVTVGSQISGRISQVLVDVNDRVSKGQIMAKLDTTKLEQAMESSKAMLNSSRARVAQAEATMRAAKAVVSRQLELQRMSEGRTPSQLELEKSQAELDRVSAEVIVAEAAVAESLAQMNSNEYDLSLAEIRSPIDGIVLTRSVEPGQTVAAVFATPELFIIAESLENMKLKAAVSEADISLVKTEQSAVFTVDAWPNRAYAAKIVKVSFGSVKNDNVVSYRTELEVSNRDLSLRPGMTAIVEIDAARADEVLLVANAALRFDPARALATDLAYAQARKSASENAFAVKRAEVERPEGLVYDRDNLRPGQGRIWALVNGRPLPYTVGLGLSDGRYTEVVAKDLGDGTPVITRLTTSTTR